MTERPIFSDAAPDALLDALAEDAHLFQRGAHAETREDARAYWRDLALGMATAWKRHRRAEHADPAPVEEVGACGALAEESMPGLVLKARSRHVETPVNLSELVCEREPGHPGPHRDQSWSWAQDRGSELEDVINGMIERAKEEIYASGHFKPAAANPFPGMRVEEPAIVDDIDPPQGRPYVWGKDNPGVEDKEAWLRWALHKLWPPGGCGAVLYGLACTYTPGHDGPHSPQVTLDHFVARVEARRSARAES